MARRRKTSRRSSAFTGLLLTVLFAGGLGWFFSLPPAKREAVLGPAREFGRAFLAALTSGGGGADDPLAGVTVRRADITRAEAEAAGQLARDSVRDIEGLDRLPGLDVPRLRFIAKSRLAAGEAELAREAWPMAHAYFEACRESAERVLRADTAAVEAFGRRRAAHSLREQFLENPHPKVNPTRRQDAEDRLAEAELAFETGNYADAAEAFRTAGFAFGELRGISDQLHRYDKVRAEFAAALGATNPELMAGYGGDLWQEIQTLRALGDTLDPDQPSVGVNALEQALQRLPAAVRAARRARALERYTRAMGEAEAARAAGDHPAAAAAYRRALVSEHDQTAPALEGLLQSLGTAGPLAGQIVTLPVGDAPAMEFSVIPPGAFTMGLAEGLEDERPPHRVNLPRPFLLGRLEVTQAQWAAFFPLDPSAERGLDLPVHNVHASEAAEFTARLGSALGLTARLPREAEWEYACRAGTATAFSFGDLESDLVRHGNFCDELCATRQPDERRRDGYATLAPVGRFQANPWGLFDLHGNVMEWCADPYRADAYRAAAAGTPSTGEPGPFRVLRGGSYNFPAALAGSGRRYRYLERLTNDFIGFRVLVEAP